MVAFAPLHPVAQAKLDQIVKRHDERVDRLVADIRQQTERKMQRLLRTCFVLIVIAAIAGLKVGFRMGQMSERRAVQQANMAPHSTRLP